MAAGTLVTLGVMAYLEIRAAEQYAGVYANEPIYAGLSAALVVYIGVSLMTRPTDPEVMAAWDRRVAGQVPEDVTIDAAR